MVARIGAHITANPGPWGRENQYWQLRDMRANTCRVPLFWNNMRNEDGTSRSTPWFSDYEMDQLFLATAPGPEFIIQSGENVEFDTTNRLNPRGILSQWNRVKWWANRYPGRHIVFELGNEPDLHDPGNPVGANQRLMQCYNWCAAGKPGNVFLAVNNVSCPVPASPDAVANASWYFDNFNQNYGYGSPIHNVQIVTVHAYAPGYEALCPSSPNDPLRILRWVRSWNRNVPVKVTEAGIHNFDRNWRAPRYVEFADKLQRFNSELGGSATAYTDSVCFYAVGYDLEKNPDTPDPNDLRESPYRINEDDTKYFRDHLPSNDCG